MAKRLSLICLVLWLGAIISLQALTAEKLRFGVGFKFNPLYSLPPMAAEENGLWKQNGLDAKLFTLGGGGIFHQAVAANSIDMGNTGTLSTIPAISRGVSEIIVADTQARQNWVLVVRAASLVRDPKALKGGKIGITRFGGVVHAYSQMMVKALELESVKFVSAGSEAEFAALRTGTLDAKMTDPISSASLLVKGEVRSIFSLAELLPREWSDQVIISRKDFLDAHPQAVKRAIKTMIQAGHLIMENPEWSIKAMRTLLGLSEEVARAVYPELRYGRDTRIDPKAIENVRTFLIDYKIISREKAAPLAELFTNRFIE